jgi:DDE superfamily endonuclease
MHKPQATLPPLRRLRVITYRVTLDVPLQLVIKVSNLLRKRRKELGTRNGTRALTCYQQAVFILAWFRDRPGLSRPGQGFGISQATAYRYKDEGVEVLRALAPTLHDTLEKAAEQGLPYLILDGTLIASDRCSDKKTSRKGTEIDKWYSGKAHEHAGLVQGIISPDGVPLWASEVRPGSTHDITAARQLVLPEARPYLKEVPILADSGYEGAGAGVLVPVKKTPQRRTRHQHENPQHAAPRSPLPGRTRLRPHVPAMARHRPRLRRPITDRRHRQVSPRPHAIRTR